MIALHYDKINPNKKVLLIGIKFILTRKSPCVHALGLLHELLCRVASTHSAVLSRGRWGGTPVLSWLGRGTSILSWPAGYPSSALMGTGVPPIPVCDWGTLWQRICDQGPGKEPRSAGIGVPPLLERPLDQRLGRDLGPETGVPPPQVLTDTHL